MNWQLQLTWVDGSKTIFPPTNTRDESIQNHRRIRLNDKTMSRLELLPLKEALWDRTWPEITRKALLP